MDQENCFFGAEVDAIHFGSRWSNFYIESDDKKIYFGKDLENYKTILLTIVDNVRNAQNIEDVSFLGDSENIDAITA